MTHSLSVDQLTSGIGSYNSDPNSDHGQSVAYRSALLSDLEALLRHETEIFSQDAWDRRTLKHYLLHAASRWLVATADNEIVGYCMYLIEQPKIVHIGNLAVAHAHRKKAIGKALLNWMIKEASKLGATRVYLEVSANSHAAMSLYEKAGFVAVRTEPGMYANSDGIVMELTQNNRSNKIGT